MNSTYELYNMYREVDILSLLNKLFASLIAEKLNLNNYLINIKSEESFYLKDILSDLNYQLDDILDKVQTLIKIKKGYPIYKLDEIELISSIKTKVSIEYKESTIKDNLKNELNTLNVMINDILKTGGTTNNDLVVILSEVGYELKKIELNLA